MLDISALTQSIDELHGKVAEASNKVDEVAGNVATKLAELAAQIAELQAGSVTQEQIDALTLSVKAAQDELSVVITKSDAIDDTTV